MATFPMLRDRVDRFKLRSYMLLDMVEAKVTSETVLRRVTEIRRQIAAIRDWPAPASVWTNVAILTMSECLDSLIREASAVGDQTADSAAFDVGLVSSVGANGSIRT